MWPSFVLRSGLPPGFSLFFPLFLPPFLSSPHSQITVWRIFWRSTLRFPPHMTTMLLCLFMVLFSLEKLELLYCSPKMGIGHPLIFIPSSCLRLHCRRERGRGKKEIPLTRNRRFPRKRSKQQGEKRKGYDIPARRKCQSKRGGKSSSHR